MTSFNGGTYTKTTSRENIYGDINEYTLLAGTLPGAGVSLLPTVIRSTRTLGRFEIQFIPQNTGSTTGTLYAVVSGASQPWALLGAAQIMAGGPLEPQTLLLPAGSTFNLTYSGSGTYDLVVRER